MACICHGSFFQNDNKARHLMMLQWREVNYDIKMVFKANGNEPKYEALLLGPSSHKTWAKICSSL